MQTPYSTLALLFIVAVFNYTDRYMLGILLPAIKKEFLLSDTQIGLLSGVAFTIFYVVMGIPIARLADKYSRKHILAISLGIWSLMTAGCGMVQNFVQLMTARIMVGVGEAGASPTSYSLISDYFPAEKRAGPISVYLAGSPAGILIGFSLGGWLAEFYSWRTALLVVGFAGFVFAFVFFKYLIEPPRGQADQNRQAVDIVPLKEGLIALFRSRTFRHIALGCSFYNALIIAYVTWLPSFFVRSYGLGLQETGAKLALIVGISQFIGVICGGYATDYFQRFHLKWSVWVPAIVVLIATPIFAAAFNLKSANLSLAMLFFPLMIGAMCVPPAFAITQSLVSVRMRAVASAVLILIINLISGGIGPIAVGMISDAMTDRAGVESLRYALLTITPIFGLWTVFHYFWAGRYIAKEVVH